MISLKNKSLRNRVNGRSSVDRNAPSKTFNVVITPSLVPGRTHTVSRVVSNHPQSGRVIIRRILSHVIIALSLTEAFEMAFSHRISEIAHWQNIQNRVVKPLFVQLENKIFYLFIRDSCNKRKILIPKDCIFRFCYSNNNNNN